MDKVVIVECISTSMIYVSDLRKLGYEPILLETYNDDGGHEERRRQANYVHMQKPLPRRVKALPDYNETLQLVKDLEPVLILPGSEMSVELATSLSNDLGLLSNSKHHLPQMTRKSEMHKALKRAGLRYIKGQMVKTIDEAFAFFEENDNRPVVLKPTHSAGSLSVFVCVDKDEIKHGFNEIIGTIDMFGGTNDQVLIQECIFGEEYIVNTISRDGKSYVSAMYKYKKIQLKGGAKIYDSTENITAEELNNHPEYKDMVDYAIKVNRAIGIEVGPVHAEFMIDDRGPVLIEVNCRICGGDMKADFLDIMHGHHETDRSLEAYLDKEKFEQHFKEGYKPTGKGYYKTIIVPHEMDIIDAPVVRIARELPSCIDIVGVEEHKKMHLSKTLDLYSNGGKIALASTDPDQARIDCEKIQDLERNHFDKLFTVA